MEIIIDFETRSHCDLLKEGAAKYCVHPTTEVLCLAWKVDDQPVQHCVPSLGDVFTVPCEDVVFVAHNAAFDAALLTRFFPHVKVNHWECTMAQALSQSLPGKLEDLGEYLNLSTKKMAEEGKKLVKFFSQRNRYGVYHEPKDFEYKFKRLIEYCKTDVEATYQARQKMEAMLPDEMEQWEATTRINETGIRLDVEYAERAINVLDLIISKANDKVDELTGGLIPSLTLNKRIREFASVESIAKDFIDHYINTATDPLAKKVLQLAKLFSGVNTVRSKYLSMSRKNIDGFLYDELRYHAAHTGRFSSRGVQLHNMAKGNLESDFYQDVMNLEPDAVLKKNKHFTTLTKLRKGIRGAIIPRDDHVFIVSDFSKIECQVLFWLAGDVDSMSAPDLYKDMASSLYGVEVSDVTDEQRAMGKSIVLGCGYAMGINRFQEECKKRDNKITKREATKAVKGYRRRFPLVVSLWHDLERAMKDVVRADFLESVTLGNGIEISCKESLGSRCLYVKLPSGRSLCYRDIKICDDGNLQYKHLPLTKPKIIENIVQATARDILCATVLRIQKEFKIVLHVHDEIVAEEKKHFDLDLRVKQFHRLMQVKEDWYSSLVLNAETHIMTRYGK